MNEKDEKEINATLKNNVLEQVTKMKYFGTIINTKFKFSKHTSYVAENSKR
jgi:hypothetical protein